MFLLLLRRMCILLLINEKFHICFLEYLVCCCCLLPSHVQLFATPRTAAHQASLSPTISQSLPKFMCIASVMPFNHLIFCHPLLLLPSVFLSRRVFSSELAIHIRWPKFWCFSISPSNEYSGLISFKIDLLISLLSKGLSRVFSSTTVWKHLFFWPVVLFRSLSLLILWMISLLLRVGFYSSQLLLYWYLFLLLVVNIGFADLDAVRGINIYHC